MSFSETKICTCCKIPRHISKFKLTNKGKGSKKAVLSSWCIQCTATKNSENHFTDKQHRFKERFDRGDSKLAVCKCGDYFEQVYYIGTSMTFRTRECCTKCK